MPERMTRFVIYGEGEFDLQRVITFLTDLQIAYNSLTAFDIIMDRLHRVERYWPFPDSSALFSLGLTAYLVPRGRNRGGLQLAAEWPPSFERIASMIPLRERLTLQAVQIASPGHWEFSGLAGISAEIRKWLKYRNQQRQEKEWRESAERERVLLENVRLRDGIIADRIRLAKEMGATDRDLAPLVNELVDRPLLQLGRHQDQGLIGTARLSDEEPDR